MRLAKQVKLSSHGEKVFETHSKSCTVRHSGENAWHSGIFSTQSLILILFTLSLAPLASRISADMRLMASGNPYKEGEEVGQGRLDWVLVF